MTGHSCHKRWQDISRSAVACTKNGAQHRGPDASLRLGGTPRKACRFAYAAQLVLKGGVLLAAYGRGGPPGTSTFRRGRRYRTSSARRRPARLAKDSPVRLGEMAAQPTARRRPTRLRWSPRRGYRLRRPSAHQASSQREMGAPEPFVDHWPADGVHQLKIGL
jgi:hypothetical protein